MGRTSLQTINSEGNKGVTMDKCVDYHKGKGRLLLGSGLQ